MKVWLTGNRQRGRRAAVEVMKTTTAITNGDQRTERQGGNLNTGHPIPTLLQPNMVHPKQE